MRKVIFLLGCLILLIGGAFLFYDRYYVKNKIGEKAVLSVNTPYSESGVFIDGEYKGPTPFFTDDIPPGDKEVRVGDWVSKVILTKGALTAINQDLGPGEYSGGEVIWLERAKGESSLVVISSPDGAVVSLDGQKLGETPLRNSSVSLGEHELLVTKEGYLERKIRIQVQKDYKLNVSVDLMLNPLPLDVGKLDVPSDRVKVLNFTSDEESLNGNVEAWLKGLVFYFKSYGFESEYRPDYYLTADGSLYSAKGELLAVENYPKPITSTITLGYMGAKVSEGISPAALSIVQTVVSAAPATPALTAESTLGKIRILSTGTGWLRVRNNPALSGEEVARVNEGEELPFLAEESGWLKIQTSDGKTGWVAGQFTQRIPSP